MAEIEMRSCCRIFMNENRVGHYPNHRCRMLMWMGLSVVWMVLMGGPLVEAFGSITSRNHINDRQDALRFRGLIVQKMTGELDFEYIPPPHNSGNNDNSNQQVLPSVFPMGTPAGLRGEAVRSALLS
eukprot:scaffold81944_cov58-Attheya_sp.AAC.2